MEVVEERQQSTTYLNPDGNERELMAYTFTFSPVCETNSNQNIVPEPEKSIECLYSKTHAAIFEQNSIPIEGAAIEISEAPTTKGALTQVESYRNYCEAALLTKICLLEVSKELHKAVLILYRKTSILDDPACGEISVWKAWLWMIEESSTLAAKTVDLKEKKAWKEFLSQSLLTLAQNFRALQSQIRKLEEISSKLGMEFKTLEKKSKSKFSNNLLGAQMQWESVDKLLMEQDLGHAQKRVEWIKPNRPTEQKQTLNLRWDLNGVMFRNERKTRWLKFNSVELLEDKKVLIKHFIGAAIHLMKKANKKLKNTGELLRSEIGKNNEICVATLLKKQMKILSRSIGLYPREEAQLHCCSIRNSAIFEKILQTLENVKGRVDKYAAYMDSFLSRSKDVAKGHGKRMPLDKWSQLNLELEVDGYIKEIYLRNQKKNGDIFNSNPESESEDLSMTIINLPTPNFSQHQTQSLTDLELNQGTMPGEAFAELSSNVSIENTCFLFGDERVKYRKLGRCLLKGKPLGPDDMFLCRDSIKFVSEVVLETEKTMEEVKMYLMDGLEHLVYGSQGRCGQKLTKNISWLQLIHRSLEVWNIDVESRFKSKFKLANSQLVAKTHELEVVSHKLMEAFSKIQNDLKLLDKKLNIFPDILKFREAFPTRVSASEIYIPEGFFDESESTVHLKIKFVDSDMELWVMRQENGTYELDYIVLLSDLPPEIQAGIICIPIYEQIKTLNKVILNITAAHQILFEVAICTLWEMILPPSSVETPDFKNLENIVLALLVSRANCSVFSMSPILMSTDCNIGNFNTLVQMLQMHAVQKKLIEEVEGNKMDNVERNQFDALRAAFHQIPDEFEIDKPLSREYIQLIDQAIKRPKIQSDLSSLSQNKAENV